MRMRRALAVSTVIYLAVFAYLVLRWDSIPDPVPIHIGPGGRVDGWAEKSWATVGGPLWIGIAITAAMALCTPVASLAAARRDVDALDALPYSDSASRRASILLDITDRFMGGLLVGTSIVLAFTGLMLWFPQQVPTSVGVIVLIAYLVLTVAGSILMNRRVKESWDNLAPDANEEIRIQALKRKAALGFFKEPRDPMAVSVMPDQPGKLQINTDHPAGKRQLQRIVWSLVGCVVLMIVLLVLV